MAHKVADRVEDRTTSTGTGAITLAGAPPKTCITFASIPSIAPGDTFDYCIRHTGLNEWEVGRGTWTGSHQFTRADVDVYSGSSGAGTRVTFSAGQKIVMLTSPAERLKLISGAMTDGQILIGQTGAAPLPKTISGDATIDQNGVVALTSGAFANPTAQAGLSAVNGTATTPMRSDGAPAIDQSISPDWTGQHDFALSPTGPTADIDDDSTKLATTNFVKVRETWVNAYDYVTDPVSSDWTSYVQAAIDAVPGNGGALKLPVGRVPMQSQVNIGNKHMVLHGHGRDATYLDYLSTSGSCIAFDRSQNNWHAEVCDLSIFAHGMNTGAAIFFKQPSTYTHAEGGPLFKNLIIRGWDWNTDQFLISLSLENAFRATVENVIGQGKLNTLTSNQIYVKGAGSKVLNLINCQYINGQSLLYVDGSLGFVEGVSCYSCVAVATKHLGYFYQGGNTPSITFTDCECEVFDSGIHIEAVTQAFIRGCVFYKRNPNPGEPANDPNWAAVRLSGCAQFDVSNNFCYPPDPADGTNDGFLDVDGGWGRCQNNHFESLDYGLDFHDTAHVYATGNTWLSVPVFARNVKSTCKVKDNQPIDGATIPQLASATATPTLAPTYADAYFINNPSAQNITDFLEGYLGQKFWLVFNNGNQTLVHSAALVLNGGVNASPPSGACMQFWRHPGGGWSEISRSF